MNDRDEIARQRAKHFFENDYAPNGNVGAEHRIANALDYIAYQLGEIKQALRRVADAAERSSREE